MLELRAFGQTHPDAHVRNSWPGHNDLTVKDKTFVYLSIEGQPFHISCKLLVDLFKRWIDENYGVQAPKRLLATLTCDRSG